MLDIPTSFSIFSFSINAGRSSLFGIEVCANSTNSGIIGTKKMKALIEMQGINIQQQNLQQENSEHFDIDVEIVPEKESGARYSFAVDIIKKVVSFLSG